MEGRVAVDKLSEEMLSLGFSVKRDLILDNITFDSVSTKSGWEWSRLSYFSYTWGITRVDSVSLDRIYSLSQSLFRHTCRHHAGPPRGLCSGLASILVVISDVLDQELVQQLQRTRLPRHWASVEYAVVIDALEGRLIESPGSPVMGAHFYRRIQSDLTRIVRPLLAGREAASRLEDEPTARP